MILIISGTNRPESKTFALAKAYEKVLKNLTDERVEFFSIADIQSGLLHEDMYETESQTKALKKVQDELFVPANKWILVTPEYNGSYPGIIKLLLDALSVRNAEETFHDKHVALVGLSSGRTGNWLGMQHLTSILNYLKMHVYHNKLAVNHITRILDDQHILTDPKTLQFIKSQIEGFLSR